MVSLVFVAKNSGKRWFDVKGKSNMDIACFPRKFFKKSVYAKERPMG